MKIIHSFVDRYNTVWKELLYSQYLSAVLAKKHYGNISFYSTPEIVKMVATIGIPYTEFNDSLIIPEHSDTWSIGKLHCFKEVKEPFLHIDNDTFLFNKIDFKKYNKPFLFSHPDLHGVERYGNGLGDNFSNFINSFLSVSTDSSDFIYDINNTYTRLLIRLIDKIDPEVLKSFHLNSIPNMNIVYIEDYETFNKVASLSLEHYYSNKELIDKEEFGPCYIEQLTLHQILRAINSEYREYSSDNKHVIFKKIPYSQKDQYNNVAKVEDIQFPFRGTLNSFCNCCDNYFSKDISIKSKDDIRQYLDYDWNGFFHPTYMKWYDVIQAIIIHHLKENIGEDKIRKVYNYFKEINPKFGLPIKSRGEKLYEELTGFSFE